MLKEMDKNYEKQDLSRFFNHIKTKYVIPKPITKIPGKVTCRNGIEYIEKPYRTLNDPEEMNTISKQMRQKDYTGCGHSSCVTNPYRALGDIVLDSKKLTLSMFKCNNVLEKEKDIALCSYNKWKNATKVVFPIVRMQNQHGKPGAPDNGLDTMSDKDSQEAPPSIKRRRRTEFVINTKKWPKIQSTGYKQISDAVTMTNRRVSATQGTTPYFKVLETDNHENSTEGVDSDIFEDTTLDPAPIDSIKRETVIKRLEAYVYVINSLLNIKNRDLKNKQPLRPDSVPQDDKQTTVAELPPIKGFSWNEGLPPWQKIKQENEFLSSGENVDLDVKSEDTDDQEFLLNIRKDFTSLQEKLDFHVSGRLKRVFRDEKQKFVRRFHALKQAPTLSLGVDELRRLDRTTHLVDNDNKKSATKQDWFNEAIEDLDIKRYSNDEKVCALVEQFERFSHTDIAGEIKSLKAKLCYLTLSMPVYYVLQPDYQYTIKFIIRKCLAVQEDFFGGWFKMRFKKGNSNCFKC